MASCKPFTTGFKGSAEDLYAKLAKLVHDHNGRITGGTTAGTVSVSTPLGDIDANYSVKGQKVTIEVTKRPFFLPCSDIEKFIKKQLPAVQKAKMAEL